MEEWVVSSDGVRISLRTRLRDASRGCVLIAPGFFCSKESPVFRRLEDDLCESFDVASMDFRGHGRSRGLYTFSAREPADLEAAIRHLRPRTGLIGVLGFSYGGAIAMIEHRRNRDLDALVCVGSPMSPREIDFRWWTPAAIHDGICGLMPGAGVRPGNPFLPKESPIDFVAELSPLPVLFIHGSRDATVDARHSVRLHAAAREPKAIKIFEGATHAQEVYRRDREGFLAAVTEWFGRALRRPAEAAR